MPVPNAESRIHSEVASYRSHVVKLFCKSVASGTKYIYQALPRLLTIWLEMGEKPAILEFSKARRSK